MRRICASALAAAVVTALALPASAQATNHAEDTHVGIGAGFNLSTFTVVNGNVVFTNPFAGGAILVPIDVLGVLRIEPEIGFIHYSETNQNGATETTDSADTVKPALGVFYRFMLGDKAAGYVGARGGPSWVNSKTRTRNLTVNQQTEVTSTRTDGALGPAFGGEYFFSKHFSLGAEMKIDFIFVGDENIDPGTRNSGERGLIVSTGALLFARTFFF